MLLLLLLILEEDPPLALSNIWWNLYPRLWLIILLLDWVWAPVIPVLKNIEFWDWFVMLSLLAFELVNILKFPPKEVLMAFYFAYLAECVFSFSLNSYFYC